MSVLEFALVLLFLFGSVGVIYYILLGDSQKIYKDMVAAVQAVVDQQNREVNQVTGNLYDRLSKLEVAAAQRALRAVDTNKGN